MDVFPFFRASEADAANDEKIFFNYGIYETSGSIDSQYRAIKSAA